MALVDDCDYEWLNQWKWYAHKQRSTYYAIRNGRRTATKRQRFFMHRVIMDAPKGMQVDHINHNGLYNRRCNLRLCTNSQNQHNRKPQSGKSRFKGVSLDKRTNKWQVQIQHNNKRLRLGLFDNEIEAAKAYDAKAEELHREFACLNF